MSKNIRVINISGNNLIINDIGNKRISHDKEKIHVFTQEEFKRSDILKNLIKDRFLVIVENNEADESGDFENDPLAPKKNISTPVLKNESFQKFEDNRINSDDIVSFGDEGVAKSFEF